MNTTLFNIFKEARVCALCVCSLLGAVGARAQFIAPVVTNVTASQPTVGSLPSPNVNISFTVSDANTNSTVDNIGIIVSSDGGNTWTVPASSFVPTGSPSWSWSAGYGTVPAAATATTYSVTWNAMVDWPSQFTSACRVRVFAWNNSMSIVPSGGYIRGNLVSSGIDTSGYQTNGPPLDADLPDAPTNTVFVTSFLVDSNLVTGGLWRLVTLYAATNGYSFDNPGASQGANYPVQSVNWYDAIKWCNARSQMEGLVPVYCTNTPPTAANLYTSGDFDTVFARANANGYRLPTEAEWEKAARGGLVGKRFPWGDTIQQSGGITNADYASQLFGAGYDITGWTGVIPNSSDQVVDGILVGPTGSAFNPPYTAPVGTFTPNGYGLYDMAGNVAEFCWDWYNSGYYAAGQVNPQGPASSSVSPASRVVRGGGWGTTPGGLRCASRVSSTQPSFEGGFNGFRCVREASSFQ